MDVNARHGARTRKIATVSALAWLVLAGVPVVLAWVQGSARVTTLALTLLAVLPSLALFIFARSDKDVLARLVMLALCTGAVSGASLVLGAALAPWWLAPVLLATLIEDDRGALEAGILAISGLILAPVLAAVTALPMPPPSSWNWAAGAGGMIFCAGLLVALGAEHRVLRRRGDARDHHRRLEEETLSAMPCALAHVGPDGRLTMLRGTALQDCRPGTRLTDLFDAAERERLESAFGTCMMRREPQLLTVARDRVLMTLHLTAHPHSGLIMLVLQPPPGMSQADNAMMEPHAAAGAAEAPAATTSVLSQLAPTVHELRTPLNAICGFADMMASRVFGELPARYAEYADLIRDSALHMASLVDDVLDLAKIEEGHFKLERAEVDIAEPVRKAVAMLSPQADARSLDYQFWYDGEEPLVAEVDARAVTQITLNLVSNAIKFTPEGGAVHLSLRAAGDEVSLEVRDTGAGMSEAEVARLGERFTQFNAARDGDARGSGLGLNLVRALVSLHQGRLTVERVKGEGTVFQVYLPRNRAAAGRNDARQQLAQVRDALAEIEKGRSVAG